MTENKLRVFISHCVKDGSFANGLYQEEKNVASSATARKAGLPLYNANRP
jgi:hypothetical protein